jgi:hypothetical protein
MNHEANKRQSPRANHHMHGDVQNGDQRNGSHEVTPNPVLNWAWAATQSHYDWMDSHAPFASVD